MKIARKNSKCISIQMYLLMIVFLSFTGLVANDNNRVTDPLTQTEREWLSRHDGKITLTNAPLWPPLASVDGDKGFTGISPDYMRLIEKKLNFKFKTVVHKTWKEMLQNAMKKKVDVVGAIQKTPDRSKYLSYTKVFIKIPNVIVVRKEFKGTLSLEKMKGMNIAVGEGFAAEEYIRENYSDLKIITVADDYSLLKKVLDKEADAMISDLLTVSHFMEKYSITGLRIAGDTQYDLDLRISIRKDWPILNRIMEKGLDLITQKEKEAIQKKWIKRN